MLEFQVRVEDCPAVIDLGLAVSVSVGAAGGGAPKDPVVQGVRLLMPQQVLKDDPEGAAGFEVWPQGSYMTMLLAERDYVGNEPSAVFAVKVAWL